MRVYMYIRLVISYSFCVPQVIPNLASALLSLSRYPNGDGMEEEPLYVNAKQYHRILKRRQARARLEAEGKIPKQRQVCVYTYMYIHVHVPEYDVHVYYLCVWSCVQCVLRQCNEHVCA